MLKGKPYVFYSRGKIRVKGLGLRQTYFVEPASDHDGTTRIMVQPEDRDSDSDDMGTGFDPKLRSPSFIRYQQLTVVKPSTPSLHRMDSNPFHTSGWSQEGRSTSPLDMVKPQRNESVLSVPDPSSPIFRGQTKQVWSCVIFRMKTSFWKSQNHCEISTLKFFWLSSTLSEAKHARCYKLQLSLQQV